MGAILFSVMAATIICLTIHIWVTHKVNKEADKQYREQCRKISKRFIKESYWAGVKDGQKLKGKD